jgi:hypothetical protein
MACGSKSRPKPNQIVQITVKKSAPPAPVVAVTEPPAWQASRQVMCNRCQYNTDGVCVLYQLHHPDRDCVIAVGVTLPYAACPAGLWPHVEWTCDCGAATKNESGVTKCEACGATPPRRVAMPYLAKFVAEQPWTPTQPRLVVTLASEALEVTQAAMKDYATRCNADFRILDDISRGFEQANKFRLANLTTQYTRVLVIDPEVWITPSAADVFSFPDGAVYFRDDAAVVLFDGAKSHIWQSPRLPIVDRKNAVMSQLQANIEASGVYAGTLDKRWNADWQNASGAYFINLTDCPKSQRADYLSRLAP